MEGTYGLCGARTKQFAVGTLLYFMLYGHEPYEYLDLKDQNSEELDRRFQDMELPRSQPTPGLRRSHFGLLRKTKDMALAAEYNAIDPTKERKTCETLIPNVVYWVLIWHFASNQSGEGVFMRCGTG
ncbi:hypothetical protein AJ80_07750 [Polytolypa hystricis UAMH7299]|uniref:Protein kinase domain-containing protein n=1 Tax=Polytolypa hystricis (strain UAMH7299) TaxID=1447883 RepID=A0A2B7XJS4_POLH7|nr:hypothetical protein AJ80_07750 [Polytolypa hystricis UAMH7299]